MAKARKLLFNKAKLSQIVTLYITLLPPTNFTPLPLLLVRNILLILSLTFSFYKTLILYLKPFYSCDTFSFSANISLYLFKIFKIYTI